MNCPNCESEDVILFLNKVWSMSEGKVYKCNQCDLTFINPIMSIQEEHEFYKNYTSHVKERGAIIRNSVEEFHEKSKNNAKERFNRLKQYFLNKKVLEVGSSTGAFLSLIDTCDTYACELSHDNLNYSKQFITGKAYTSLDNVDVDKFDVICMFHVFEHIRDPIDFLKKCRALLNKNGLILIEVPCSDDPLLTLFNCNEFKDFVFQPMHPMIYNEKSLDYVFNKAKFNKVKSIYYQRYGLDNHLSWLNNRQPGGDIRFEELFGLNVGYKDKLEIIKKTDTIFYIAELSCDK